MVARTAHTVWLSVGDGPTDDFLTLSDHVGFNVRQPGPAWPTPDMAATSRELQLPISLYGDTADAIMANKRAIETMLRKAQKARGPHGIGALVTLGIRLFGASDAIYLDILRGGVKIDQLWTESGWAQATLFLTCAATASGDDITVANLLSYTDDASNAAWVKSSVTVAADNVLAPDGSLTADTLTPSGSNASMYQAAASLTAHSSYAFSVWLCATSADVSLEVALYDAGGTLIATQPVLVSTIWQRYWVSADIGSNTAVRCQIGGNSAWASGEVVAWWGAQLQLGGMPSDVYLRVGGVQAPLNGDQGWYLYGIPGDTPAPLTLTIVDQSTGGVAINSLLIGARSGDDLRIGDYQPVVPFSTASGGTSVSDGSAYLGSSDTSSLGGGGGTNWGELSYAALTDVPYNRGRFDVRARLSDSVTNQPAPTGLAGTVTPGSDVATQTPSIGRIAQAIAPSGNTSLVVSLGGATTAGSTLLAFMYCDGDDQQVASASGFLSEGVKTIAAADGGNNSTQLLKQVNAPSVSSVTFSIASTAGFPGAPPTRILVVEVQHVTADPITQFDYMTGQSDPEASFDATTTPGQLALGIWGAELNTAKAGEWANGFTEAFDAGGTVVASKVVANKGDTVTTKGIGNASVLWFGWRLTLAAATAAGTANAGTLGPMTLTAKVAAVDYANTVSAPSSASTPVTVTVANSKVIFTWAAPASGGTSHYRLVVSDGTTLYEFLSDTTSYELTDLTEGVVVTGYPTANGTSFVRWRGAASTTAQTERYPGIVTQNTVSGQAELLELGAFDLPPAQRLDDGSEPVGAFFLQQAWAGAAGNTTAADVVWFFPAGNTAALRYTPTPRTTTYNWVYESRRDGTATGALRTAAGDDAGTLDVRGRVEVGPVAAHIVVAATAGNNNPDMVNLQAAIGQVVIRPQYRDLIGRVA